MANEYLHTLASHLKGSSTCQKRQVVCILLDEEGLVCGFGTNKCEPSGGTCHRLDLISQKEGYDVTSECNWTHAERDALNNLFTGTKPVKAIAWGHTFFCGTCEDMLREVGVTEFEIYEKYN